MNNELAVVGDNPTPLAQTGGLGIEFGSKLFRLKPATLGIVQPSTTADGAIKGKLRISETGDQFDSLFVTLLVMPVEQRQYYQRIPGQDLNRSPENLLCFSSNVTRDEFNRETSGPDAKAKVPQSLRCHNCPKASWDRWRQTKDKADIPSCDLYYKALLIDTEYKMPLQMYIRSSAKTPFEQGMQNLSRKFAMMKAKGLNPNIFDIGFKLSTKKVQKGQTFSWIPQFSDFRVLDEAERAEFGEIYQQFVTRRNTPEAPLSDLDDATQGIDSAVVEATAEYIGEPGSDGAIII